MTSTFLGYSVYANDLTRSLQRVAAEPAVSREKAYYEANIGKVTSVDQFVNNYRLFTYAMKAYGLSDMGNAKAFMKKVLESDLSDPKSFANKVSDVRYRTFAKAFQFATNGTVAATAAAQTSAQTSNTEARFAMASTASAADQKKATAYYAAHIASVTSVAEFEKDTQLYDYVRTAYGLGSSVSQDSVTKALESDLSDRKSFAFASGNAALMTLASDFNFASDGKVATRRLLQSGSAMTATTAAYTAAAGADSPSKAAATAETTYYAAIMPLTTNVDSFLRDSRLVAYAEKAYGIPTSTTTAQLKAVLSSDLGDPKSTANKLGPAYRALAAAFNVTPSGTISRPASVEAQNRAARVATSDAYFEQTMEAEAGDQNDGVRLALYFKRVAPSITSPYQILGDKALTKVVQTMLGLSANSSKADVDSQARNITSRLNLTDLKDPKKLDRLVARFSALYDLTNGSSAASSTISLLF